MKPVYVPKGKAKEYGDYAINIYTGCPHRCYYCFAPSVLRKNRKEFHSNIKPREGVVEAVKKQLETENITDRLIHLCFTCDPYPYGHDSTPTREIIKAIKSSGNHVQILTKNDGSRDFDLLDENDWYGVSISCNTKTQRKVEPSAPSPLVRLISLEKAKYKGIKTWVSFEPVIDAEAVIGCIVGYFGLFDKIKVGKLNYWPSDIDWKTFGATIENVCIETGVEYYIKDDLRKAMETEGR